MKVIVFVKALRTLLSKWCKAAAHARNMYRFQVTDRSEIIRKDVALEVLWEVISLGRRPGPQVPPYMYNNFIDCITLCLLYFTWFIQRIIG